MHTGNIAISSNRGGDEMLALRVDNDMQYEIGDVCATSRRWDDNEPTDDMLDGTSGIEVDARSIKDVLADIDNTYVGDQIVLIRGWHYVRGEDEGEVVIKGAEVVAVWDI